MKTTFELTVGDLNDAVAMWIQAKMSGGLAAAAYDTKYRWNFPLPTGDLDAPLSKDHPLVTVELTETPAEHLP